MAFSGNNKKIGKKCNNGIMTNLHQLIDAEAPYKLDYFN